MRIIDVWIKKNGEHLENGTPYITDECANPYTLLPVPRDYFNGEPNSVIRIARIIPEQFNQISKELPQIEKEG